jgi:hypothetical protein
MHRPRHVYEFVLFRHSLTYFARQYSSLYDPAIRKHFHFDKMNEITLFEHLSNDLLLEIFDYLHALDLFLTFSSILFSAQLHLFISKCHCRSQMKFLSSHLIHHAHQSSIVQILFYQFIIKIEPHYSTTQNSS